jgi:Arc/MetJ-type ribon-helix-helix transcriptional regulator
MIEAAVPYESDRPAQRHEDRQESASLEALRAALIEGENSGPGEPFDVEAFLAARRAMHKGLISE